MYCKWLPSLDLWSYDLSNATLLIQKKIVYLQEALRHNMSFMMYRVCISCLFLLYFLWLKLICDLQHPYKWFDIFYMMRVKVINFLMEMSYHLTHSYEPNICAVVCNEYMHNHRLPYFLCSQMWFKGTESECSGLHFI